MRQLPDGQWIGVTRSGTVHRFNANLQIDSTPILTIAEVSTQTEMGLLDVEVHPAWPSRPYVYFYYTTKRASDGDRVHVHIDRFTTSSSGSLSIAASSRVSVLDFDRGDGAEIHLGGTLAFDPMGSEAILYTAMGDGGRSDLAQDPSVLHGKLIRFYVDQSGFPSELVGVGLRNPFRFSFDSATGDLWIGDVGEDLQEEIDFVAPQRLATSDTVLNFGWPILEGTSCRNGGDPRDLCGANLSPSEIVAPAFTYDHGQFASVGGGRVYRGAVLPAIQGRYFFNDIFGSAGGHDPGWYLAPNPDEIVSDPSDDYVPVIVPGDGFVQYVEGLDGELYAIGFSYGQVYRLESSGGASEEEPVPTRLSQTGCFAVGGAPNSGLIEYEVNAPLWSDGAEKRRWFALPDGARASLAGDGDFLFPAGTVLAKEFWFNGVRVETRLFMRHPDGVWAGYTYAWLDSSGYRLNDAELVPDRTEARPIAGTSRTWEYPSRSACLQCHTAAANRSLGIEAIQLADDYDDGAGTTNQLMVLSSLGIVSGDVTRFRNRTLPRYSDTRRTVEDRTASYLHSNCSGCHRAGAIGALGRSNLPDLRFDVFVDTGDSALEDKLCGVQAGAGDLGLGPGALLIEPGNPGSWTSLNSGGSVLYLRMSARDTSVGTTGAMPPLATHFVDVQNGLPLVRSFIQSATCRGVSAAVPALPWPAIWLLFGAIPGLGWWRFRRSS